NAELIWAFYIRFQKTLHTLQWVEGRLQHDAHLLLPRLLLEKVHSCWCCRSIAAGCHISVLFPVQLTGGLPAWPNPAHLLFSFLQLLLIRADNLHGLSNRHVVSQEKSFLLPVLPPGQ